MSLHNRHVRLLLDNIRSVHNVGSIFRTAETLGIEHIYCLGTTPTPHDRFNRPRTDFAKVALGAENMIPWEHVEATEGVALVKKLKKEGYEVIALEQAARSCDYKDVKVCPKTLIILGAEVDGVANDLQEVADVIAEIPQKGQKESLNVSVAAGIFLYRLLDK